METMSAHDPVQKQMAKERKEERILNAEAHKQEALEHNAAARERAFTDQPESVHGGMTGTGVAHHSTTGNVAPP